MGKAFIIHNISFSSNNLGQINFTNNSRTNLLRITALENLTLTFSNDLEYTTKVYPEWNYYTADSELQISAGTTVIFRGNLTPTTTNGIGTFTSTGEFNVSGSPLGLINNQTITEYAFKYLFKDCTKLINAEDLNLPSTVAASCYEGMFKGCTGLESAPVLLAQTLATDCYKEIFYGCSSLDCIKCYNISDISDYVGTSWVTGVSATGTFEIDYNGDWDSTNKTSHIPSGWTINDDYNKPYSAKYFTIEIITGGYFTVLPGRDGQGSTTEWTSSNAMSIDYKLNNGSWTTAQLLDAGLTLEVEDGDIIKFRGTNTHYCNNSGSNTHKQWYVMFGCKDKTLINDAWGNPCTTTLKNTFTNTTAAFNASGNIMSLCYGDNFVSQTTLPASYTFCSLFKMSNLVSAENLILPATTLLASCYRAMFSWCIDLVTSPTFIDATLNNECYKYMFESCSSLRKITCLVSSGLNGSNFEQWTQYTPNNQAANVVFVKNPNTTVGTTMGASQWCKNSSHPIPVIQTGNNTKYGLIGSTWIIQDYVES